MTYFPQRNANWFNNVFGGKKEEETKVHEQAAAEEEKNKTVEK